MTDEAKRIAEALHNGAEYNYCNSCMVGEFDDCNDKTSCVLLKAVDLIEELSDELDQANQANAGLEIMLTAAQSAAETYKRQRDAAVNDLNCMSNQRPNCDTCIYRAIDVDEEPCKSCFGGYLVNNWEWRGPQDEP